MARTPAQRTLDKLAKERDALRQLEDPEREKKIHAARTRRNRLILAALSQGASERTVCTYAGVTRGIIWKLKH